MTSDEDSGYSSESPLFSDYQRLDYFLTKASLLAEDNDNFNPRIIRAYFNSLKEIWRMFHPIAGKDIREKFITRIEKLDKETFSVHYHLLSDKSFKVNFRLFRELDKLHQDLLDMKQLNFRMGFQVQKADSKTRLAAALDVDFDED